MYIVNMRRTSEETEQTRQSLLDAAMAVFLAVGYSDCRIEDIASRAGVTRGAFYHHFSSKPEIYYALLVERYAPSQSVFGNYVADIATPAPELLKNLSGEYLRLIATDRNFREAHELVILKSAFVPELSEGFAQKVKSQRDLIQWLEQVVERGKKEGTLKKSIVTSDAAAFFFSALSGIVSADLIAPGMIHLAERYQHYAELLVMPFVTDK
jgi:TetR/AcrR family acrAB operon transcriptional repressor